MKDYPIKWFWSKLMVASRSINNIPDKFLEWAQNVRIYDGWIWPRLWKQLLTNSSIWTNNKGGFTMNSKLFQITNSKVWEIDTTTGWQTDRWSLWYDAFTDISVYWNSIAIITSDWQTPKFFNGTAVANIVTVPAWTTGIVEYCRNYSFITKDNILYISRPITAANPEYAYDWTWAWSQNITYDSKIIGLKGTMNGLFVLLENKVEYLWANALQNVSGSATFISTPLGEGSAPISNACIAASGDKIFYISRNLQIQTINYLPGATNPSIWELSARPVIGIRELLSTVSSTQTTAFAYYNENDKLIEFHLRSINNLYNNYVIIYDLINDTWSVDTWKNYNYVVKFWYDYYWFSDINSSIYKDSTGFSDAWVAIDTVIRTWGYTVGTILHKLWGWFFTAWAIWFITQLEYNVYIDWESVFQDVIDWNSFIWVWLGDISWEAASDEPLSGELSYSSQRIPFDKICDEWRIYQSGKRISIEITSKSLVQDFIIDILWFRYLPSAYSDVTDKF